MSANVDIEEKSSNIDLSYRYAVSDELAVGIDIPYQLTNIFKGEGTIENVPLKSEAKEETGLDDVSIGAAYRFPRNGLREAIVISVTFDNASDKEGQSEIEIDGTIIQQLEKAGQGNGYKIYSLEYYFGIVHNSMFGIELSPYLTHRENTGDFEPGDSYGVNLSGRYQVNNNLKVLFGSGYDVRVDTDQIKSYNTITLEGGIAIQATKQSQVNLSYSYNKVSDIESKNSDLATKEISENMFSISLVSLL